MRDFSKVITALIWAVFLPAAVYAQASIAGAVRDTSGAVLPGVTVEATSPALIEGARAVTTDGSGQYRIIDLRPGTYTVTFTLTGFRTIRREGIELSGTFTASVNADMSVGALEETITVTGEAPIVDVQSSSTEARIGADVISAIPTGRQFFNLASLVPGVDVGATDVGGSQGPSFIAFRSRGGSRDEGQLQANGFPVGWQGLGISYYVADLGAAQEVAIGLSGGVGDARAGGPTLNVIGKEGGNTFAGSVYANFASGGMVGSNFTQAHRDLGLRVPNALERLWDTNVNFGGPIVRDRVWFFSSYRHQGNRKLVGNMWANLNAGDPTKWTYEPDFSRQSRDTGTWINATTRLTFQATARNKLSVFWDEQAICRQCLGDEGGVGAGGEFQANSPEATPTNDGFPQRHAHALWTSPVNNRLLLEGGASLNTVQWGGKPKGDGVNTLNLIQVTEQTAAHVPNLTYRSTNWTRPFGYTWTWRASASYVTGTHTAKVGYEGNYYWNRGMSHTNDHLLAYRLNNGVPNQLTMTLANARTTKAYTHDYSLYAQDQWTRGRLTLQGAVRYEYITSGYPEQRIGPSRFLPEPIVFPAQESGVRLHDIAPRVGFAYDLFGTGRTAVKATFGRYPALASGSQYSGQYNPANRLQTSTNRSWRDANSDFVPDCDLLNPVANGECGPWSNGAFGNSVVRVTHDPDVLEGWNKRLHYWDLNAGIRHELLPRLGIEVDYIRKSFGNFTVTDNRLVGPGDFDSFCITAPVDSRLPSGVSGSQICGLWDITPAKFGLRDDYITFASNYGEIIRNYNGVNFLANARMTNGLQLQGGFNTGRSIYDECEVRKALPETAGAGSATDPRNPFCRAEQPWQTSVNALATYTIPRIEVQVSGTFYSKAMQADRGQGPNGNVVAGESLSANWIVPNGLIAPSLNRNLAGSLANTTVRLIEPGTLYGDRINNVDLRVAKLLRFNQRRLLVGVDIYNALNSSAAIGYVQTFGPSWLRPTTLLQARFVKISAQLDF